ncbi:MAG: alpha-galactosidase [Acidobacteria bacterium]|nr:MAG: alpha-galactosidase [Acidobacteriota bacterium]
MGWNSWDSYGTTVNEEQVKTNARWMADHLKSSGWEYVVVDMEWFVLDPSPSGNSAKAQFSLDEHGRYTPPVNRFPSAAQGAGFKPLAEYIHSLGLKFGIHILRGIPKLAVDKNLPIEGSPFRAGDAANTNETCPWNPDNYGTNATQPAAQAYYDSIARLYAGWDVDLIKADCISSRPYKSDDIRMLSSALRKTGRAIVLSLSPGAAPLDKVPEMREYAQMWRISDDVWDLWHSTVDYPQGLGDQFPRIAQWAQYSQPGHWPDADMLPIGYLGPAPGWGKPRWTRLTHDEQRTLLTLWSIFRSPLMIGGNLPSSDAWTTSLLTNADVLAIDQHATSARAVLTTEKVVVWTANAATADLQYLAFFNLTEQTTSLQYSWHQLGFSGSRYQLRDLWEQRDLGTATSLSVSVPAHGVTLYGLAGARRDQGAVSQPLNQSVSALQPRSVGRKH